MTSASLYLSRTKDRLFSLSSCPQPSPDIDSAPDPLVAKDDKEKGKHRDRCSCANRMTVAYMAVLSTSEHAEHRSTADMHKEEEASVSISYQAEDKENISGQSRTYQHTRTRDRHKACW